MYLQYFIVLSAEGFEEGKSLLTIDILRRAGIARVSSIKDREINGCDGISAIAYMIYVNGRIKFNDLML